MYYIDRDSLFEFTKRPRRSKPDAHSHLLVWTHRERRVGLYATWAFLWVSQRQHHLNFRATPMIESLRTTQIAFFRFATPCGFFRGSGDEVQKVSVYGSVQEKLIWNHLWEHRFSVPDPRAFPPPETTFRHRRPKAHFMTGRTGSPVINAKEEVEFHNEDTVGGDNWNKFISTLDAKNSKLNKTELTSLLTATTTMMMNTKYWKPSP